MKQFIIKSLIIFTLSAMAINMAFSYFNINDTRLVAYGSRLVISLERIAAALEVSNELHR